MKVIISLDDIADAGVLQPPVNPPMPREDDAITAAFNGARATIAELESKRVEPDYTAKVDALFAHAAKLGFTEQDFADLAVAAADQAGADLADQRYIAQLLGIDPFTTQRAS